MDRENGPVEKSETVPVGESDCVSIKTLLSIVHTPVDIVAMIILHILFCMMGYVIHVPLLPLIRKNCVDFAKVEIMCERNVRLDVSIVTIQ